MKTACAIVCALLIDAPGIPAPSMPGGYCMDDPDRVDVRDDGIGCSLGFNQVLTTPNGISVRVVIDVNVDNSGKKESVTVIPQTDGYFAFPPTEEILDGEQTEILVMGGMS